MPKRIVSPYLNNKLSTMFNRIYAVRSREATVFDGSHRPISRLPDGARVQVNYGMRKRMNGNTFVYIRGESDGAKGITGWILQSKLEGKRGAKVRRMPTILNKKAPDAKKDGEKLVYRFRDVTEGDYGRYRKKKVSLTGLKDPGSNRAEHYLDRDGKRAGGKVNMTGGVPGKSGGLSNDTFEIAPSNLFVRSRGEGTVRKTQLYTLSGKKAGTMTYYYGRVGRGENARYGWVAAAALKRVK